MPKESGELSGKIPRVSESTVRRLSKYYRTLDDLISKGIDHVSSDELARMEGFTSAQVRKDFSFFGNFGKRGLGYSTHDLKQKIAAILGLDRQWNVAIIGAGNIGTALIGYHEFSEHGFQVKAIFDSDPDKIGKSIGPLTVQTADNMVGALMEMKIDIAILAIPADVAQNVADRVVKGGVKAILNFAPRSLSVSPGVTVRQENTTMELEALAYHVKQGRGS